MASAVEKVRLTIHGDFMVEVARNLAWMDEERPKAIRLLGNLMHPEDRRLGLSLACIDRILDGHATLEGDSTRGIRYVETIDLDWVRKVNERQEFFTRRKLREERKREDDERRRKTIQRLEDEDSCSVDDLEGGRRTGPRARPGKILDAILTLDRQIEERQERARKAGDRLRVSAQDWSNYTGAMEVFGRFKVPQPLYTRYRYVVRTIRQGAFLGVPGIIQNDPLAFLALEEERVELHDAVLRFLGVERKTDPEVEVTMALYDRLADEIGNAGEK